MSDKIQNNEEDNNLGIIKREIKSVRGYITKNIYEKIDFLGKGAFGKCYRCIDKKNNEIIAIKEIPKKNIYKKKLKIRLNNGINIHRKLDHKNIVKLKDSFEDYDNVYIILNLCENGDLRTLLNKRKKLKEIEVIYYVYNLISALKYLKLMGIIHLDIKLEHIYLDDKMVLKLGDFGLSMEMKNIEYYIRAGTIDYMAPEILEDKPDYSDKNDIWAIGIIMYYLIIGKLPFNDKDKESIINNIKNLNYEFPKDAVISKAAKDLIKQILVLDPKKRPTLHQILKHDFFNICRCIPKYIPIKFKNEEPSLDYITYFIPNIDINKEPVHTNLISEKDEEKESEKEIENHNKEDNIENDVFNIYIIKFNINEKFGLFYFLNNNNFGAYFNDNTKFLYNQESDVFLYVDKDAYKNDVKYYYKMSDEETFSSNLKKKCKLIKIYYETMKKSSENYSNELYSYNTNEKLGDIYLKTYILNKKAILFQFTNRLYQIFYKNNDFILISRRQNQFIYNSNNGYDEPIKFYLNIYREMPNASIIEKIDIFYDIIIQEKNKKKDVIKVDS